MIKINTNNAQPITLQQFFEFVKKSDEEKLDDVTTLDPATQKYLRLFHEHGHKKFFGHGIGPDFSLLFCG